MSNNNDDQKEPNLFGNTVSYDQIREKSNNDNDKNALEEIMKNLDNNETTQTEMMWHLFANQNKLVPEDEMRHFEKPQRQERHSEPEQKHHTETINDYVATATKPTPFIPQTPKPSAYGPSFGEGPSIAEDTSGIQFGGFATEEELNLAKLHMLRNLGELTQYGVKLSQNYNMKSDYKAMKYEYELHRSIRDKHNGVKWLSNLMLNVCYGAELANENFNPFEFKLKGWHEQMEDDIDEYYDVLGELYEKYFKAGKPIPPELKFILMVGGSAVKFHIAHAQLSKAPTLTDELSQNPELARKLHEQSVTSKMKANNEKQKGIFEKGIEKGHEEARKKAEDLQMLKNKHDEYLKMQQQTQNEQQQEMQKQMMQQRFMQQQVMQQQMMQQQILDKQKQLEDIQKQLNMQRSDVRSSYTNNSSNKQKTMTKPIVPDSLKNRFSLKSKPQNPYESSSFTPSFKNSESQNYSNSFATPSKKGEYDDAHNNAYNMGFGGIMSPDQLQNKINDNDSVSSIDKNIDKLITDALNDNQSVISDDGSYASRASARKTRKRKQTIKINT